MSSSVRDREETTNPWTQKGFVTSAVVVGLIAVLAAVLLLARPSTDDPAAGPVPTQAPSPSTSTEVDEAASVCGLPPSDQAVPRSEPPTTNWELVGTIATPTAPETYGPGRVEDGLRTCYARSPLGALYAAVNFVATTSAPDQREQLIRQLAAAGPGRDAALAALAAEGEQSSDGSSSTQVVGFSFLNYDEDSTTVDLALRGFSAGGAAGLAHLPLTLRWEGGDWKVVLPEDGDLGRAIQGIPDLTGYVPWSGA